jgi:hypothetical protein
MPPMKAVGMKTAPRTRATATTGPLTSRMAMQGGVARGQSLAPMKRSTFSTTTMASSTTMPMARTSPNKVRLLSEPERQHDRERADERDTGTASSGMIEARQVWRKSTTTMTTSRTASTKVPSTDFMEARTNFVVS